MVCKWCHVTVQENENMHELSPIPYNIKIIMIIPAFPPKFLGGTEIAGYNIVKYLAKRGHNVHVMTQANLEPFKESKGEKFYVHSIQFIKLPFFGLLLFWLKVLFILQKLKPDIIHAQTIDMGVGGLLAKIFLKKPYVVYGRGGDVYSSWMFKNFISKIIIKNANAVFALTEDMKKEMTKIYKRDIIVIPNGIDILKFKNLSKRNIRRIMNIPIDEKIIIFVGRLKAVKGIEYLIKAMEIIQQKNGKAKLMIVGDGAEKEKLETLVDKLNLNKNVMFIGKISNEDIPKYLIMSDIFVLPSLREGFPNVILEAMASGLPIIASNVGGIPEIIKNGENGFLVEPKNPEMIAEKILMLFENNELRKIIIEKNKEDVKRYSWEDITEKLEENYRELINTNRLERNIFD
jgi:N-acetyl-alpha-D-glucosaminyl L-malate synthase BshA